MLRRFVRSQATQKTRHGTRSTVLVHMHAITTAGSAYHGGCSCLRLTIASVLSVQSRIMHAGSQTITVLHEDSNRLILAREAWQYSIRETPIANVAPGLSKYAYNISSPPVWETAYSVLLDRRMLHLCSIRNQSQSDRD